MPRRQPSSHPKPTVPSVRPQSSLIPSTSLPTASFGQTIKDGIGFGAGSAIGHRIVGAILGPSVPTSGVAPPGLCASERDAFELCLKTKHADNQCNNEMLSYKQCIELK